MAEDSLMGPRRLSDYLMVVGLVIELWLVCPLGKGSLIPTSEDIYALQNKVVIVDTNSTLLPWTAFMWEKGIILFPFSVLLSQFWDVDISPGNLHSNCDSSSPAFNMMYSA